MNVDDTRGLSIRLLAVELPENIREFFRRQGKIGAQKRHAQLSPERRREIARKAVQARWAKAKARTGIAKRRKGK